jgi:hypothetical protein
MSKKIEEIITEMSESGHLDVKEDICKDTFRIQGCLYHGLPQWRWLRMR